MTILDKLEEDRIFSVTAIIDHSYLEFRERCDGYFDTRLNKKEAQQLIDELQYLVNNLKD